MTAPGPHPPPHPAAYLSARQAAALLNVNEKTVRRWIDRGHLFAEKDASGAYRIDPAELDRHAVAHAAPAPHQEAAPAADSAAPPPHPAAPIDLSPLVDHIASLEDRVQQLTEAATAWQFRAMRAEEQLLALGAGDVTEPATSQDRPSASPEPRGEAWPPKPAEITFAWHFRRWLRRMTGG